MKAAAWRVAAILAPTQIVSWGAMFYSVAILAPAVAADLGFSRAATYDAFSWSLLVAGVVSAPAGILLDRFGGRAVINGGAGQGKGAS